MNQSIDSYIHIMIKDQNNFQYINQDQNKKTIFN